MVYAVAGTSLAFLVALLYAYLKGRENGVLKSKIAVLETRHALAQKAILALSRLSEKEKELRDVQKRIDNARDPSDLERVYAEIIGKTPKREGA